MYSRAEKEVSPVQADLSSEELCEARAALKKLSTKPRTDYHSGKIISTLFKQISNGNYAN